MVVFYSFPQVSQFPHCPLYMHIFSHLDRGLVKKPEHELSKLESTQVLHDVWTWYRSTFVPGPLQPSKAVLDPGHEDRTRWRSLGHITASIRAVMPKGIDTSTVQTWSNPRDLADISILWHSSQTPCNHLCTSHHTRTHSNKTWELNISITATLLILGTFF